MVRSPGDGPFPHGVGTLLIDGEPAGTMETDQIFWLLISFSGLDIGLDRGTTVADYDGSGRHLGPFAFTGKLVKVDDRPHARSGRRPRRRRQRSTRPRVDDWPALGSAILLVDAPRAASVGIPHAGTMEMT